MLQNTLFLMLQNTQKHLLLLIKGKITVLAFVFSYEDKCYYTLVKTGARLMNF